MLMDRSSRQFTHILPSSSSTPYLPPHSLPPSRPSPSSFGSSSRTTPILSSSSLISSAPLPPPHYNSVSTAFVSAVPRFPPDIHSDTVAPGYYQQDMGKGNIGNTKNNKNVISHPSRHSPHNSPLLLLPPSTPSIPKYTPVVEEKSLSHPSSSPYRTKGISYYHSKTSRFSSSTSPSSSPLSSLSSSSSSSSPSPTTYRPLLSPNYHPNDSIKPSSSFLSPLREKIYSNITQYNHYHNTQNDTNSAPRDHPPSVFSSFGSNVPRLFHHFDKDNTIPGVGEYNINNQYGIGEKYNKDYINNEYYDEYNPHDNIHMSSPYLPPSSYHLSRHGHPSIIQQIKAPFNSGTRRFTTTQHIHNDHREDSKDNGKDKERDTEDHGISVVREEKNEKLRVMNQKLYEAERRRREMEKEKIIVPFLYKGERFTDNTIKDNVHDHYRDKNTNNLWGQLSDPSAARQPSSSSPHRKKSPLSPSAPFLSRSPKFPSSSPLSTTLSSSSSYFPPTIPLPLPPIPPPIPSTSSVSPQHYRDLYNPSSSFLSKSHHSMSSVPSSMSQFGNESGSGGSEEKENGREVAVGVGKYNVENAEEWMRKQGKLKGESAAFKAKGRGEKKKTHTLIKGIRNDGNEMGVGMMNGTRQHEDRDGHGHGNDDHVGPGMYFSAENYNKRSYNKYAGNGAFRSQQRGKREGEEQ